jgi:hypothetical protein
VKVRNLLLRMQSSHPTACRENEIPAYGKAAEMHQLAAQAQRTAAEHDELFYVLAGVGEVRPPQI